MLQIFKNWFHDRLVKALVKNKLFTVGDINEQNRTIFLGFWSLNLTYASAKETLCLSLLQKHYKYTFTEETLKIVKLP